MLLKNNVSYKPMIYFFLAELSCMSNFSILSDSSKMRSIPHARQRLFVEDATHVTKLKEESKLLHATKVNKETVKNNKLTHATKLTYVRKLTHLHAKLFPQATSASCVSSVRISLS